MSAPNQSFASSSDPLVRAQANTPGWLGNAATLSLLNTVVQTIHIDVTGGRYLMFACTQSTASAIAVTGARYCRGAAALAWPDASMSIATVVTGTVYAWTIGPF